MKSVLVTIAPAIEPFTSAYSPARSAAAAITNSVRFPSVALSSPPTVSPVFSATDSVAWLSKAASGTIARTERMKSSVCAVGTSFAATDATGTRANSQNIGLWRSSLSRGVTVDLLLAAPARLETRLARGSLHL